MLWISPGEVAVFICVALCTSIHAHYRYEETCNDVLPFWNIESMEQPHFFLLEWLLLQILAVICSLDTGLWLILFSNANVLFSIL